MYAAKTTIGVAAAMVLLTAPALADHNSKNGEGWANMPNDIHNTRVETKEANDNEAFRDFVKYGEGSKTVNRFDSDDTTAAKAKEQKGEARQDQQKSQARSGERTITQNKAMQRTRDDTTGASRSSRTTRQSTNRTSRNTRQTTSQRSNGRKGGGRK